ncbi:uncharacterized protein LOC105636177 [Jatropha curcas]|uniref:uncharacterized protein LOC105636177 n=1 Tax=Jatropha curcas TaxID=180498 RepID=UPI0005FBAF39|nr:uncharacterized protein LOC105636177 [Jatropha curcas]
MALNVLGTRVERVHISADRTKEIPLTRRMTISALDIELGACASYVHKRIKDGDIKPHSNAIKPLLKNDNKISMINFCISMIDEIAQPSFNGMHYIFHIDEKWFYLTKAAQRYYLTAGEEAPLRKCKSKKFIPKIMFFAGAAQPWFNTNSHVLFDGKIDVWPFNNKKCAKWNNKNREVGTLETKPMLLITKAVIREVPITKLLPTIKEKWPQLDGSSTIFTQQDNAKPHIYVHYIKFVEAARDLGMDIRLSCQPPNSPNLNVLNLGFLEPLIR